MNLEEASRSGPTGSIQATLLVDHHVFNNHMFNGHVFTGDPSDGPLSPKQVSLPENDAPADQDGGNHVPLH